MRSRTFLYVATTAFIVASTSVAFAQTAPPASGTGTAAPAKKDADPKAAPGGTSATPPVGAPTTTAPGEQKSAETPAKEPELKTLDGKRAIYVALDIGYTRPDLGGFSDDLGFDKTGANGIAYGIGAGVRLQHWRFGAHFRGLDTTEFTLWEIMAEVGYGFGLRPISPAIYLRAGYAFDIGIERGAISGQVPKGALLPPDVDVKGLVVGLEGSFPYYLTDFLRVGPYIGFDLLALSRQQADLPQSILPISDEDKNRPLYKDSGSGIGYTLNLGLRGSFDVAF